MENSKEICCSLAEKFEMQFSNIESNIASFNEMIELIKAHLEKINASRKRSNEFEANLDKTKENAILDLKELKDRIQALENRH